MSDVSLPPSLPKVMSDVPVHPAEIAAIADQQAQVAVAEPQVPVPVAVAEPPVAVAEPQVPVPVAVSEPQVSVPVAVAEPQVPVPVAVSEPQVPVPVDFNVNDEIMNVTNHTIDILNQLEVKMKSIDNIVKELGMLNLSDKSALDLIMSQKNKHKDFVESVGKMYSDIYETVSRFNL